jgi:hypothetical protein
MAGALADVAGPDGAIEAARVLLAVLDGATPPVVLRPATIEAMAALAISALRVAVSELGATGKDQQDFCIRQWLGRTHEIATLAALGDGADAGG